MIDIVFIIFVLLKHYLRRMKKLREFAQSIGDVTKSKNSKTIMFVTQSALRNYLTQ